MPSLARWCFTHGRLVVLLWIVGLMALGAGGGVVGSKFSNDFQLPNTESKKAIDLLTAAAPAQSGEAATVVVHAKNNSLDDPTTKKAVETMLAGVGALPHVSGVGDFYKTASGSQSSRVSADRRIGFVDVQLDAVAQDIPITDLKQVITKAKSIESHDIQVELGGNAIQYAERGAEGSGSFTEVLGLLAAAVVLFIAFGSIYTMFLPILTALLALGTGISIIGFLSHGFSIAAFGPTLAALIGLGVGVDYALFIVSRHRVNLMQGHDPEESVMTSINTSGRAVMFAGTTVCIGILGLLLLGVSFLYGLALSVVVVVLLTMLASVTFLPAMLGFVGMKALSKKQRNSIATEGVSEGHEDLSPGWFRWAKFVQRHPVPVGSLALVAMLVLAIPVLSLRLGTTDAGGDPAGTTTRKAYDLLADGFGAGFNGPLQLVARTSGADDVAKISTLVDQIKTRPGVASATPVTPLPGDKVAVAQVYPASSPQDEATTNLINDLRKNVIHPYDKANGTETLVSGQTAIFQDFSQVLSDRLPLFIGVVIALSFVLLMAVFRSVMIPLVASLMNLLAAGASFGVVVAIFQWGWAANLFGIDQTGPILSFLPVMAFAILFGLSMDYEVFLVSRMYEEWQRSGDNDEAILLGQAETGRVITAAAAIMVVLFGSFVFGGEPTIKLFGVALAGAVFLDALLIRSIIVPAIMHMLGNSNWYLPKFLDRVLPKLNVEATATSPASTHD